MGKSPGGDGDFAAGRRDLLRLHQPGVRQNGQLYVPLGVITPSDSLGLVTDAFVSGKFTVTRNC